MINFFIAKTKPKEETIIEHTDKLIKELERLKNIYPKINFIDWSLLRFACLYHDLGKMNTKFQNKLMSKVEKDYLLEDNLNNINEIPHGYLSPAFLPIDYLENIYEEDDLRILYQSIYYHHSREKLENSKPIEITVENDLIKYWNQFSYDKIEKVKRLNPSYVFYTTSSRIPDEDDCNETVCKYIITKGLLNKIDFAASAGINVEEENIDLFEKTMKSLNSGGYEPNELQRYMIKHQNDNNIIIASTGIGKTEAALFWIGNSKGFFTLPLRVSLNAIYDRVIGKISFQKEKVGLLHSETASEYLKRSDDEELDIVYYDKTKQLSLPLTICTLDQLVDFVFKYEGFELKLATLSYSKLVIDEIQMYSPEMVAYLVVALKYIDELNGKFSIVTATFPPIFEKIMRDLNVKFNKSEKPFYKKVNGKVQLRHKMKVMREDININHIIRNYKNKKVLIIVNTVKQAQRIYDDLKKALPQQNINLFHSKFIRKDRYLKEQNILNMGSLTSKEKGIWITTQVVEASLDIDFDVLYTELSDISGLLQRLGRVYRNRDLIDSITNAYVYIGKEKLPSGISRGDKSIIDFDIFNLSQKAIERYSNDMEIDEIEKMKLVETVYSYENLKSSNYYKKIKFTIEKIKDIKAYEIKKSEINLRNIENVTVMPQNVYFKNKEFIENQIKIIEYDKNYNNKLIAQNLLKDLALSIPKYEYEYAKKNRLVSTEFIQIDKFNNVPIIKFDYSLEKGLSKPKEVSIPFDEEEQFI
ncbi:CRISPR-associated helicase Cas3' [Clostridium sp. 19966]|uniref:CRISPR-associated helicase Cas3' n=1 Tax=Clostridium sp. 19966 TaxID=2768166 RepID=UPI0028DFC6C4|nr:CRISPR-associated helicase Cas3' [Clostridium sp. 19966]MDT8719677.1 CRISPR-associated helicase Cas3' [Clostridium sp. 19966]